MSKNETEEEDEFYDSETEPSFCEEADFASKFGDMSLDKSEAKKKEQSVTIFAVQLSNKSKINGHLVINNNSSVSTTNNRIFVSQENAMRLCKEDPENRRFKSFKSFHEAYTFSYETSEIESGHAPSLEQIQASLSLTNGTSAQNGSTVAPTTTTTTANGSSLTPVKQASTTSNSTQDAERLPFPAPKKPEVNLLRSFIEQNKLELFRDRVVANPRFLISAGDAPVAVQVHECYLENKCVILFNTLCFE
jgi:hypothetical protein